MNERIVQTPRGCSMNPAHPVRPILATLSAGICALTIVVYQSWFMPYFLPFFTGRDEFAKLVFHALYGGVLIISIAVLVTRRDVLSAIVPLAIAAAMAVAPVALHPVGIVAKCYLITLFLGGAAIVLMLASAPAIVLRPQERGNSHAIFSRRSHGSPRRQAIARLRPHWD